MIPYIHPKFVEALTSPATDASAKDALPVVPPHPILRKKKNYLASLRRRAARLRSLIAAVVTNNFILLLICACLLPLH
jgi:hypothetical protein